MTMPSVWRVNVDPLIMTGMAVVDWSGADVAVDEGCRVGAEVLVAVGACVGTGVLVGMGASVGDGVIAGSLVPAPGFASVEAMLIDDEGEGFCPVAVQAEASSRSERIKHIKTGRLSFISLLYPWFSRTTVSDIF
jgi:hypothetical protein